MSAIGHHWLLDLSECRCPREVLEQAELLRHHCVQACRDAGLSVVGDHFHQFTPSGVTGAVLLAESHLTVHTWPELAFVALDVYVCDHNQANAAKGDTLSATMLRLFQPAAPSERHVKRLAQDA